jgi:Fe-S oxidoreductase
MKRLFAPGCALMLYKPRLAERLLRTLDENLGGVEMSLTCCRHVPRLPRGAQVINVCPGCDRRYRKNYADASTVSLWEVLAETRLLPLPDYAGREMTIIDACPTRGRPDVHDAIRTLIRGMNISLVEPERTRERSTCCGDDLWGTVPTDAVVRRMREKAAEMPVVDIVVHCVSCCEAMFIGGRTPRYLLDLLFGEETVRMTRDPDVWHGRLDEYIAGHAGDSTRA